MYNEFDPLGEKIVKYIKAKKWLMIVLVLLLCTILFLVIKGCSKTGPQKSEFAEFEKAIQKKANNYIDDNDITIDDPIFISFDTMEFELDENLECKTNGGVLVYSYDDGYEYEYYYQCRETSSNITMVINGNEKVEDEITLKGSNPLYTTTDTKYEDPGYDSDEEVETEENVVQKSGVYYVNYILSETGESATRIVIIEGDAKETPVEPEAKKNPPILSIIGESSIEISVDDSYADEGAEAYDEIDGDLTEKITTTGEVEAYKAGTYTITYSVTNSNNLTTTATRTVVIVGSDTPEITLFGDLNVTVEQGNQYKEEGYTANDDSDGDITDKVEIIDRTKYDIAGIYTITYKVTNSKGKTASVNRYITVEAISRTLDVTSNVNTTLPTNQSVVISLNITGNNYNYTLLPDNTKTENVQINYNAISNGTYTFKVYDKLGEARVETITVSNIDRKAPKASCSINSYGSVTVTATDDESGIRAYKYESDVGKSLLITTNRYLFGKSITKATVYVYDKANNVATATCEINDKLEIHFINIGREDAIAIRTNDKVMFIDGGLYSKGTKIKEYLQNLGVTKIDAIIGSHLHNNHIQAQAVLLNSFEVDKIYYDYDLNKCLGTYCKAADQKYILSAIKNKNKTITVLKPDDVVNIGNMKIEVVGPINRKKVTANGYQQNYNSLNFILTFGANKFYFSGDGIQESSILSKYSKTLLDVDLFKYPHHGGASITKAFAEALSPKYVMLTDDSTYRLKSSYEKILKNAGTTNIYRTGKSGNILVESDGENIKITTGVKASDYKR